MDKKLRLTISIVLTLLLPASGSAESTASGDTTPTHATAIRPIALDNYRSPSNLSLVGVVYMRGNPMASLFDANTRASQWVGLNDHAFGYLITEITPDAVTIQSPSDGRRIVIPISGAPSDPKSSQALVPYTKQWINSRANPMLITLQPLPIELYKNWPTLSPEEKQAFIDFYKSHGWRLISSETIGGATNFAWENIYAAERNAAIVANRDAFLRSLTKDQKLSYETISTNPVIKIENGEATEAQMEIARQRQRAFEQFKNSLSPAQKAGLESIHDFTKADWK